MVIYLFPILVSEDGFGEQHPLVLVHELTELVIAHLLLDGSLRYWYSFPILLFFSNGVFEISFDGNWLLHFLVSFVTHLLL